VAYSRSALEGARLHWLLDLTIRGRVYRFSVEDLTVDDDGTPLHYAAGLADLEYEDAISAPGAALEPAAALVEVLFFGDTANGWAALVATDHDIGDTTGDLALWKEGTAYTDRHRILSGPLNAPSFGAPLEPVTFELSEAPWEAPGAVFPPADAMISADTWPRTSASGTHQIGGNVDGLVYPWVFGSPGRVDPYGNNYPALPALLVEIPTGGDNTTGDAVLLVAGHPTGVAVAGNHVRIWNRSEATWPAGGATFVPSITFDRLGRQVTIVTVQNADGLITDGDELWAAYVHGSDGGLTSERTAGTMRAADEVVGYLLDQTGIRVLPVGLRGAADRALAGLLLDFVVNETVNPLDLVLDDLLPLLPAVWRIGPDGWELRPWRWDATVADAVARIDPDTYGGERADVVRVSSIREVVNEQRVRFCLDVESGNHRGRISYAADPRTSDTEREPNPWSFASVSRYGVRAGPDLETDYVMVKSSAAALLDWRIAYYSQTRQEVSYLLPQSYQSQTPGDVVLLTDSELGWTDRVCLILSVVRAPGPTVLTVSTVPDWVRDAPTT